MFSISIPYLIALLVVPALFLFVFIHAAVAFYDSFKEMTMRKELAELGLDAGHLDGLDFRLYYIDQVLKLNDRIKGRMV